MTRRGGWAIARGGKLQHWFDSADPQKEARGTERRFYPRPGHDAIYTACVRSVQCRYVASREPGSNASICRKCLHIVLSEEAA